MTNIYLVSDTHFNHKKLCSNEEVHFDITRKYKFVNEMNDDIIKQWNNTITNDDIVYFLGDFMLGTPFKEIKDKCKYYLSLLNHKNLIWIEGNHDGCLKKVLSDEKILYKTIQFIYNGKLYVLQHEDYNEVPEILNSIDFEHNDVVLVHGHTHSFEKTSIVSYKGKELIQNNVCWEAWYKPVSLNELKNVNGK